MNLNGTEQVNSTDIPHWDKTTIPESAQVIMLVDENNQDYGGTIQAAYRLDVDRLVANNTRQGNIYSLDAPGADISVPEGTIVPAYVESFAPYALKRAQASSQTTKAQFLIISLDQNVDDAYVVQSSGFYTFPVAHEYQVGVPYYLSDSAAGGVTTIAPVGIAQPLFTAINLTTIQVLIGE